MKMKLEVSPDPLVGKEVFAIIHIRSIEEAQHTKLEFRASEGIEVLTEATEFYLELKSSPMLGQAVRLWPVPRS